MALTVVKPRELPALLEREERVRDKLADARVKLKITREVNAAATAEPKAHGGQATPPCGEPGGRAAGLDEAVRRLQKERGVLSARAACFRSGFRRTCRPAAPRGGGTEAGYFSPIERGVSLSTILKLAGGLDMSASMIFARANL